MDSLSAYKTWAPEGALWTDWAKPVLFARPAFDADFVKLELPTIDWLPAQHTQTMLIVDRPGLTGVAEGLALARLGFRPVPLYNGVSGPKAYPLVVPVGGIVSALFQGAELLELLSLEPQAPPAFLLDFHRMKGAGHQPGTYDNRWCVFPQDMPSAAFLVKQGIQEVIVRSEMIHDDLSHILVRYQAAGLKIHQHNGKELLREVSVRKPSRFKSMIYRYQVILGLKRHAAGGFGAAVPEATQSSGARYYGVG